MSDFEYRATRTRVQQRVQLSTIPVVVGDDNVPSRIFDTTIPGNVWVRLQYANGYGRPISVRGPIGTSIELKPGAPVELFLTADRRLQIKSYDPVGGAISGIELMAANMPKLDSGEFFGQQSLITALVTPQRIPDKTVVVKSWAIIIDGIYYAFPGSGSVDLTSLIPSLGNHRYAVVFVQDDFSTVAVVGSTSRGIIDYPPLGSTDVQECLDAEARTSTPLAAIRLYGGQTQILNNDIKIDLRQMINTTPGSGSSSGALIDSIQTDANGDVQVDANGNVIYV